VRQPGALRRAAAAPRARSTPPRAALCFECLALPLTRAHAPPQRWSPPEEVLSAAHIMSSFAAPPPCGRTKSPRTVAMQPAAAPFTPRSGAPQPRLLPPPVLAPPSQAVLCDACGPAPVARPGVAPPPLRMHALMAARTWAGAAAVRRAAPAPAQAAASWAQ
jgi:hypothetical protein